VRAVLEHAVGAEKAAHFSVLAGDVVPAKKPDPAIYALALERTGADRDETIVVEDSRNGLLAAVGAGLRCVVTVSSYTQHEDFSEAVLGGLAPRRSGRAGQGSSSTAGRRSPARTSRWTTLRRA
jgi:beta-phosphoglucomutase-like phosphatase (HAD superfamily)